MEIFNDSPSSVLRAEFPGHFENLSDIAAFVRKAAVEAGLDDFSVYSVETAVDEACSNIIEHAYKGKQNGIITITCTITPGELTVELRDTGKSFDPTRVPKPKLDVPLEERQDSGLGLYFINQLMDEVVFSFDQKSGNTLTMKKKASPLQPPNKQ